MRANRIKYPVGIQTFREIRESGYLYVDKTGYIKRLLNGKYYFLSRPRRFGKSLLLSTLEAYFRGERHLFKGLLLDSLTDDWEPHPIIHLDLNNGGYQDKEDLLMSLDFQISGWEKDYGINNSGKDAYPIHIRFGRLIKVACEQTGKKVVVLVDEYDKPLLNVIGNEELSDFYRTTLKALYSNLKSMDRYIKFAMLTGVARFSKVSIFSDLNNLRDISFVDEYAGICGITSEEMSENFKEGFADLSMALGMKEETVRHKMKQMYDGYHFTEKSPDIYNPFSIMNVFENSRFDSYWFDSGTPTYLVKLIEQGDWRLHNLAPAEIEQSRLANAGIQTSNPIPVCFQAGYLTIKGFDPEFKTFLLDYPNEEVKEGFLSFLVPFYIEKEDSENEFSVKRFILAVKKGDIDEFMRLTEIMISRVPYSEKGSAESHFQNAIYLLFSLMGFYVRMEERISNGRLDLILETEKHIFIFEFKVDSSAEKAMEQIYNKKYWIPFLASNKKIFLIGANFNAKERCLTGWKIEHVN